MRLRHAVVIAVALTVGACGVALDGYSGGPGAADAGSDAASPNPDVEAGGSIADSGSDADAVAEASIDGGLDCSGAIFCDDFERASVQGSWDVVDEDSASKASISSEVAFTGKSSLHIDIGAVSNPHCQLEKTLAKFSQLDISYALYRETNANNVNVSSTIWNSDNGTYTKVFLVIEGDAIAFIEQAYANGNETSFTRNSNTHAPFPLKTWVSVHIQIDFAAKTYNAWVDGQQYANNVALVASYPDTVPVFQAGSDYASDGVEVILDIDSVVLKLTP